MTPPVARLHLIAMLAVSLAVIGGCHAQRKWNASHLFVPFPDNSMDVVKKKYGPPDTRIDLNTFISELDNDHPFQAIPGDRDIFSSYQHFVSATIVKMLPDPVDMETTEAAYLMNELSDVEVWIYEEEKRFWSPQSALQWNAYLHLFRDKKFLTIVHIHPWRSDLWKKNTD